jgi:hypothetical protein
MSFIVVLHSGKEPTLRGFDCERSRLILIFHSASRPLTTRIRQVALFCYNEVSGRRELNSGAAGFACFGCD